MGKSHPRREMKMKFTAPVPFWKRVTVEATIGKLLLFSEGTNTRSSASIEKNNGPFFSTGQGVLRAIFPQRVFNDMQQLRGCS